MNQESSTWREDVISKLSSIETKLDALLEVAHDHEHRLRYLEKRNAIMIGACAMVSFAAAKIAMNIHF